ncbi:hypothetical protein FRC09_010510 [Ceratobasidium sp. 395]|nr:hypothetical protein FRC09_010510 [Ceratobasidium sp. 395]
MKSSHSLAVSTLVLSYTFTRDLCDASQKCRPSSEIWSNFNASINERRVASRPPAWPCHDPDCYEAAYANVKANWNNSFWRVDQAGAMQDLIWESLDCDINTPRNEHASRDSKAFLFAGKYNLRLVIKNTGHDYLGRSSRIGSLSIWTRQLKGIKSTRSFAAAGCKPGSGVPTVTQGAAETWLDVYEAADDHNVMVVGGSANSVGTVGGWLQGGGHGPLASLYDILQVTVVKTDGKVVIANACRNKDLFWALRGGGGGTYGVVLDAAYKTHPFLDSIVGLGLSANVTDTQQLAELTRSSSVPCQTLPMRRRNAVEKIVFRGPL